MSIRNGRKFNHCLHRLGIGFGKTDFQTGTIGQYLHGLESRIRTVDLLGVQLWSYRKWWTEREMDRLGPLPQLKV